MRSRLPLDTLQAFEAAARRGSFAGAAHELALTPSAVSHQIKKLERMLGFDLFDRDGRTVRLNASGSGFLKEVRPALRSIEDAAVRLADRDGTQGPLVIACSSMFANRVLSLYLPQFAELYPSIECTLLSVHNDAVLDVDGAEVGVLFGSGSWSEWWSMSLGSVRYAPVCSPRIFTREEGFPGDPAVLMQHVVIHIDDGDEWRRWAEAAGIPGGLRPHRQLFTNDVGFALEIAVQGGGVTLASDIIASSCLRNGTLVRPFSIWTEVPGRWHLVARPSAMRLRRVQIFIRWLAQNLGLAAPDLD